METRSEMTFSELLDSVSWAETKAALLWCYPDSARSLEGYRRTLARLQRLTPVDSNMRIVLKEGVEEGVDHGPFIEVVGRNGQLNRDQPDFKHFRCSVDSAYASSETDLSLSLEPWEHWLGMRIDAGTLSRFTPPQIAAHCLWDMTFHGFEQWQVKEGMEQINRRADELAAMTEEDRKRNLIPMEEVVRMFDLPKEKQ